MWCRMSDRQSAQLSLACWLLASAILFIVAQPALAKKLRPIPPAIVAVPVPPLIATGSLFNAQYFSGLVTDRRARRVGDLITIRLVERTRASKSASAESGRDSDNALRFPPVIPFANSLNQATQGGSAQSFKGSGTAEQNNELFGEITVTVAEVLPGGVLRIAGEKRLMLNRGEEHLQLTGLVRVDDLGFDNVVPSTRVADARIRFGGTGQVADNSRQGWLARFFAKIAPL